MPPHEAVLDLSVQYLDKNRTNDDRFSLRNISLLLIELVDSILRPLHNRGASISQEKQQITQALSNWSDSIRKLDHLDDAARRVESILNDPNNDFKLTIHVCRQADLELVEQLVKKPVLFLHRGAGYADEVIALLRPTHEIIRIARCRFFYRKHADDTNILCVIYERIYKLKFYAKLLISLSEAKLNNIIDMDVFYRAFIDSLPSSQLKGVSEYDKNFLSIGLVGKFVDYYLTDFSADTPSAIDYDRASSKVRETLQKHESQYQEFVEYIILLFCGLKTNSESPSTNYLAGDLNDMLKKLQVFRQDWGEEAEYSICARILGYICHTIPTQLTHESLRVAIDVPENLAFHRAVQYLCGDRAKLLEMKFTLKVEGETYALAHDTVRQAKKAGYLTHPKTKKQIRHFEKYTHIYFQPKIRLDCNESG